MSKLFSMESDEVVVDAVKAVEPEVTQVAEAATEVTEGAAEIEAVAANVEAGTEATEDLGEVQEVLESAVEEGGMSPVAAEAVRIAVGAICSRIGADVKSVYPMYAAENFSASSSRQAKTKLALEGVSDFAKDVYKRIKAALESMWKKIKAFWDKHISTLGQVKKAVESMKKKVKSANELKGAPFIESAPGSLVSAFQPKGELNAAMVKTVLANHTTFSGACTTYLTAAAGATAANLAAKVAKDAAAISGEGLVGGVKIDVKVTEDDGKLSFEIDRDSGDSDAENKGMLAASKDDMTNILQTVGGLIDGSIAARKGYDKAQTAKATQLETLYRRAEAAKSDAGKEAVDNIRLVYKAGAFDGRVANLVAAENIRAAKVAMSFVSASLARYK